MDYQTAQPGRQVAFVFDNVSNYQQLVSAFRSEVEVHVLDASQDGLAQMATFLEGRSGLAALHVIGHGAQGSLDLGSVTLTSANIGSYGDVLGRIGSALAAGGDILLYGCDVGANASGAQFVGQVAQATGADVAASTDATGGAQLGGNWVLEYSTGTVSTGQAFDGAAVRNVDTMLLSTVKEVTSSMNKQGAGSFVPGFILTTAQQVLPDTGDGTYDGIYFDTYSQTENFTISADGNTVGHFDLAGMRWVKAIPTGAFTITITGHRSDGTTPTAVITTPQNFTWLSVADDFSDMTNLVSFDVKLDCTAGGSTPTDLTLDAFVVNNIVAPGPTVTDARIGISGASGQGGEYKIGDTVTATWNNTAAGDNNANISSVNVNFSQFGGGAAVAATNSSGIWTATYTITAGSVDATARNVSVTATGSNGVSTTTGDTTNASVDNVAPTVTDADISISGASGTGGAYKIGDTVTATWNNTAGGDNNSDTISSVKVDFSQFGGGSAVTATNSAGTWTATYTIVSGAIDGTANRNVSVTATDNAGNTTTVADTTNATVDNVAPSITFSGLAFSSDTGTSSSDFITASAAQAITATLSGAPAAGAIVYGSLDNGASWTDITSKVSGTTLTWNGVTLPASSTLKLKVTDAAGNDGTVKSQAYTLDTSAPSAPSTPDMTSGTDSGSSNTDNLTNNVNPTFTGNAEAGSTVTLYDSDGTTVLGTTTATGGAWSITSSTLAPGSHGVSVKATDAAGNTSAASSALQASIDTAAPAAIGLSTTSAVTANATSTSTIATLSATDSHAITYSLAAGNGTNDANNGNFTISGTALKVGASSLAAGTYKIYVAATDAAGNVANQAFTITLVDAPSVDSVSVPANGTHYIGENLDFTVNFSQAVLVDTSGGTPRIAITLDTGGTVYANYLSGSGSSSLVFRHVVANGEADATGITLGLISLQGGTIRDGSSNNADTTLNSVASTAFVLVDGTLPHVMGVSASTANGAYKAGSTITIDVAMDRSVTVDTTGGVPTLALSSGGTATYASGSGTATLSFTYVVGSGENAADLDASSAAALSLNGATLKDAGGGHIDAATTLPVPGAAGSLGANKNLVIDTVAPTTSVSAPALASDTGTSATDFVTKTAAQTISATLSAPLAAGESLYGSLDNGATWTDISAKVSGTALAWNGVTLSTSSTLKFKVADAAGNDGPVLSQAYVLDTTAPAQTFTGVHISADTGAAATDYVTSTASQTITATLGSAAAAGDKVYGSLDGGATWTDITAKLAGTTLTWDGAVLSGSSSIKLKLTDAAGNDGAVATQAYVLDTVAPSATIASAAFANDTGTSATDFVTKAAAQTISGTLSGTIGAGETVYVSLDNGATWSAATAAGTSWSLAGQTLAGSGMLKVKLTDLAGNDGAVYSQAYVLDTTAPAISFGNLSLSADTGSSATDFVTKTATQTIRATLNAPLSAGDVVYGSLDGGATWTDITAKVSALALAWDGAVLSGANSIKLKVSDAAGNDGSVVVQSYVLDTVAPVAPSAPALTLASDSDTVGDGTTNLPPVLTGTALANAQVELYDGAISIGTGVADANGKWTIAAPSLALGAHTLLARQSDAAGNQSDISAAFTLRIERAPVEAKLVDGVPVAVTPVSLPGGQTGTLVNIPVVPPIRVESSGSPGVADIPLATSSGSNILLAQLPTGYGLSATGGASQPALNASANLLAAIKAASAGHQADDTGHLTGNGQAFLDHLAATQPLLVETVVPVAAPTGPSGTLALNGPVGHAQSVALVIDSTHLPTGSTLNLQNVDFAAVIGAGSLVTDNSFKMLSGDAAGQHFTVATGGTGSVYAGGGDDGLTWGVPAAQNASTVHADVAPGQSMTLLHGGAGTDTVTFNGTRDSFTISFHNGYEVVASKAEPNVKALVVNVEQLAFSDGTVAVQTDAGQATIAGLYMGIYGRQPDLYGFEFWSSANQLSGLSYGAMALSMINQSEWAKTHEAINGNAQHDVGVLYSALFGRSGDAAGVAFWAGAMQQHGFSLDQIADYMIKSAEMNVHQRAPIEWDFLV